jgi:O-antigen ligase
VDLPLAAFGVILVLSTVVSAYHPIAVDASFVTILSGVVLFGSFAWLLHRAPSVRIALLRAWALGAPPAAVIGLIAGLFAHDHRAYFPQAPMGPNGFGTMVFLGSLVALGLAYRAREQERWLWLGCSLVSFGGLLATESRSALAGWVVGAAYLTWREIRDRPRRLTLRLASGLVVVALVGAIALPVGARVGRALKDLVTDRMQIWRISATIIEAHPVLGTGPGTFQTVYDRAKPAGLERKWSAHNLWLNFATETGFLGLASVLWVVLIGIREWVKAGRQRSPGVDPIRPIVTGVLIGLFVDQCGDNTLLSVSTISGFWLLLAMMVIPPGVPRAAEAHEGGAPGRASVTRPLPVGAASP